MKSFDIKVGKGRSALSIDAAKLIDGCALIQGTRGSGKSYLARVIETLVSWNGIPLSRAEAAENSDLSITSSTFSNAMTKLRRLGLMKDVGGQIAVSEDVIG